MIRFTDVFSVFKKEKKKEISFSQKCYHKGAFLADDQRPILLDKFDKSTLSKPCRYGTMESTSHQSSFNDDSGLDAVKRIVSSFYSVLRVETNWIRF